MGYLSLLGLLVAFLGMLIVLKFVRFWYREWTSPLNDLPCPPSKSWLFGHLKEIWDAEHCTVEERWLEEYDCPAVRYKGLLGTNQLFTTDLKVMHHILTNSYDYQKPAAATKTLEKIVGPGLLVVEGERHKRQRRVMNPAFGPAQIRELTEIFVDKSIELRDIWATQIAQEQGGKTRIDVLSWLSRMTLDVIGLAGFHYKFDNLANDPEKNELSRAFSAIFEIGMNFSILAILRTRIPLLQYIPSKRSKVFKQAQQTMLRIGNQLLKESKAALGVGVTPAEDAVSEKVSWMGRDLLSTLVRANVSSDVPTHQRMSDAEVVAQIATSITAGHETTSTGATWALYALAQHPESQRKLREELLAVGTDNPTMDELNSLVYLDAVVRECLRLFPPIPSKVRVAMKDDVLPLSTPMKDRKGRVIDGIRITKGQMVSIPIMAVNRKKSVWGEDAHEYRPERWLDSKTNDPSSDSVPGIWGNMLTFFGGPRSCIGYRFSLVEMKALLFTLVRAFEFEPAVPPEDIIKKATIVLKPLLASVPKGGNQMPLLIRPCYRE